MSETTHIEWASHTASPWFGCTEVSPGCANCYARQLTLQKKWAGWGDNSPRVRSKGFWKDAYRLDKKAGVPIRAWKLMKQTYGVGDEQLTARGFIKPTRPRMFTSLMDWLDPKVPIEWLADFLKVVHDCQNLDWLLLTKRPELWTERIIAAHKALVPIPSNMPLYSMLVDWCGGKPPTNVWLGVTVENQAMADKRIPLLLSIPAKVRWLSVEPLLDRVDLDLMEQDEEGCAPHPTRTACELDWVVVGGESGSKRPDCGAESIVSVAQQCQVAGVPCFVKQDCSAMPGQQGRIPANIWSLKQYPNL